MPKGEGYFVKFLRGVTQHHAIMSAISCEGRAANPRNTCRLCLTLTITHEQKTANDATNFGQARL